jgi:choline dehydrogenase-like flavoprotein
MSGTAAPPDLDFLVVGSGPSGVHAARTLLDAGAKVRMIDVGVTRDERAPMPPDRSFLDLRRHDPDQYRYFLGEDFAGIPLGKLRAGSGLSTPRQFVTARVDELTPHDASPGAFSPVESLAAGGLGGAWGLGCFTLTPAELEQMGLPTDGIERGYQTVADRIGISATPDDGTPHFKRGIAGLQPGLDLDEPAEALLQAYARHRAALNRRGVHLGRTALALLSRDRDARRASAYHDMDFWSDHGGSAWRPARLLEELRRHPRFEYRDGQLALRFRGLAGAPVTLTCHNLRDGREEEHSARRLVLAAGALGTARIVLRSHGGEGRLPLLCNPYYYSLCLRPGLIGRELRDRRHSLGQLVLTHDPRRDGSRVTVASLLSYRSRLLFRLIQETPIAVPQARAILARLQSALTVAGIFHPDGPVNRVSGSLRGLSLVPDRHGPAGDRLHIDFSLTDGERAAVAASQRVVLGSLRRLGCWPVRTMDPGMGASIHYGGTLPYGADRGTEPGTGRLRGAAEVWLADGSPFRFVPAKGITLTLMAHADWVARQALGS